MCMSNMLNRTRQAHFNFFTLTVANDETYPTGNVKRFVGLSNANVRSS